MERFRFIETAPGLHSSSFPKCNYYYYYHRKILRAWHNQQFQKPISFFSRLSAKRSNKVLKSSINIPQQSRLNSFIVFKHSVHIFLTVRLCSLWLYNIKQKGEKKKKKKNEEFLLLCNCYDVLTEFVIDNYRHLHRYLYSFISVSVSLSSSSASFSSCYSHFSFRL